MNPLAVALYVCAEQGHRKWIEQKPNNQNFPAILFFLADDEEVIFKYIS